MTGVSLLPIGKQGIQERVDQLGLDLGSNIKSIINDWETSDPTDLIPTGIPPFDELLRGGLMPGEIMVIAAQQGHGKTSLGTDICRSAAALGTHTAFFSLEMDRLTIAARHVQALTGLEAKRFVTKEIPDDLKGPAGDALNYLEDLPMTIVECASLSADRLYEAMDLIHEANRPGLIVLDYIQLLTEKAPNRDQELSKICNTIRSSAKKWKTPLILLCQLNRGPAIADNRKPLLSDLRESGSIEQMASTVALMHPDVPSPFGGMSVGMNIHFDKMRMGQTGSVKMTFKSSWSTFVGA